MIDEEKDVFDQSEETSGLKAWFEDNSRILLSILVVVAIAGGIYSYSKRVQAPTITDTAATQQQNDTITETPESTPPTDDKTTPPPTTASPATTAVSTAQVSETETSLTVKATRGQGETHVAREALANYLTKNPDSQLTKEHKIYIEDYLRKHNTFSGHVSVGTSIEFQKTLIQQAIGQAKNLTPRQLDHLKIYSARVTSMP